MRPGLTLIPAGVALVGVSYGLARFALGLFLPEIRNDLGFGPEIAGAIGGGTYAGYCLAIVVSAFVVERLGPRRVCIAGGLVAATGMALIAVSESPWMLAAAVVFAGLSTGLTSPPLAQAVSQVIPKPGQPRANTLMNSGTSVGVALSGPIALAATGAWREAYLMFAALAAISAVWAVFAVPGHKLVKDDSGSGADAGNGLSGLLRRDAVTVVLAAAGMGFASAAYWTFAGEVVTEVGALSRDVAGMTWLVLGLAGLFGAAAGDLIQRFGINAVHRGSLIALAAATILLVTAPADLPAVLLSAALFGAAYIMLTGVYLVWGVRVYADRPAIGLGLPFLMIAVGQVAGAPVAGLLAGAASYTAAFTVFAAVAILTMRATCRPARSSAPEMPAGCLPAACGQTD